MFRVLARRALHFAAPAVALMAVVGLSSVSATTPMREPTGTVDSADVLGGLQNRLRLEAPESFGGLWVAPDGVPHIMFRGSSAAMATIADEYALPLRAVFVEGRHSESGLRAIHDRIIEAAGEAFTIDDFEIVAIETDIPNNRVNLVLLAAAPTDVSVLQQQLGPDVVITTTDSRAYGNACTNSNCPNPLKAGLRLYKSSEYACMSGFVMRYATSYWLSTAGHCSNLGDSYQHPAGSSIGSVTHQG